MADNKNTRAPAGGSEPAWKKHGRNGPFDWWLACQTHGYDYARGCMSCSMASDHNADFAEKLNLESAASAPAAHGAEAPADQPGKSNG